MPDTEDDQSKEDNRAIFAKYVYEDLQNGLAIRGIQSVVKVLDGE